MRRTATRGRRVPREPPAASGRVRRGLRRGRLSDFTIPASDPGRLTGGRASTMRTLGTVCRIVAKLGAG